ncbi:MAG TPA: response regulator [Ktedonobacterales bacterium]|jgi:DNA-binding NtrC family response regulator|nr:response regulator [Ktedonobacterales bacterium]
MDTPTHASVLVVDDDEDVRATLRMLLEGEGYAVAEAVRVADALAYLRTAPANHVVLLDFLLPPVNADVLLLAVEAEACLRRHRLVLMSASPTTRYCAEAQRLIAALCSEVVLKPFDVADVLAAVERAEAQVSVHLSHCSMHRVSK